MVLGDVSDRLNARQADALAQGLLMSLLRLEASRMPWVGSLLNVTPYDGQSRY